MSTFGHLLHAATPIADEQLQLQCKQIAVLFKLSVPTSQLHAKSTAI